MGIETRRTPSYRIILDKPGLPKSPNFPDAPRPHVPHHAGRIAVAALSLAMIGVTAEGAMRPSSPDPIVRAGEIPAEQMRYPWDSGNTYLELNFTEVDEGISVLSGVELTNEPAIVPIGEDKYVKFVLGEEYGELDNPYGHIKVELINDVMKGGIWEKSVDAQGNTILGQDGKLILNQFGHVESVPEQAEALVTG